MMRLSQTVSTAPTTRALRSSVLTVPHRTATTGYGSVHSSYEQGGDQDNPKKGLEHPGPESPLTKMGNDDLSSSSGFKNGAEPKMGQPTSAIEDQGADVKQHNKYMTHRSQNTAGEPRGEGVQVNAKFWTGNVGDIKKQDT